MRDGLVGNKIRFRWWRGGRLGDVPAETTLLAFQWIKSVIYLGFSLLLASFARQRIQGASRDGNAVVSDPLRVAELQNSGVVHGLCQEPVHVVGADAWDRSSSSSGP